MTSTLSPTFERTLCLIKPDAVANKSYGDILEAIQNSDLTVTLVVRRTLTPPEAESFYDEHRGKPFFHELITSICAGPLLIVMLDGLHAISRLRTLIGPSDLTHAAPDTLRARFASATSNAIHGADSAHAVAREYAILFPHQDRPALQHIA